MNSYWCALDFDWIIIIIIIFIIIIIIIRLGFSRKLSQKPLAVHEIAVKWAAKEINNQED